MLLDALHLVLLNKAWNWSETNRPMHCACCGLMACYADVCAGIRVVLAHMSVLTSLSMRHISNEETFVGNSIADIILLATKEPPKVGSPWNVACKGMCSNLQLWINTHVKMIKDQVGAWESVKDNL
jgi:hypothetical protein